MPTILEHRTFFWGLLLLGLAVIYLPGLGNPLVFDDQRFLDGSLFGPYGGLSEFRQRMLSYGTFVWVDALAPGAWWLQRLINLILHTGVAGALYAFYRALTEQVGSADGTAASATPAKAHDTALKLGILVFALNPVAVYAVTYLIQRSILLATLFSVLSAYALIRGFRSASYGWFGLSALLYVLAVLSKEQAIMVAGLALPLYVFVCRPGLRRVVSVGAASLIVLLLVTWMFSSIYSGVLGKVFDPISRMHLAQLERLEPGIGERIFPLSILNQMSLFWAYAVRWILPLPGWLSVDLRPVFPLTPGAWPHLLGAVAFVGVFVVSAGLVLRRSNVLGMAALCVLMAQLLFMTEFATVWLQDPFVLYRSYLWALALPGLVWVGARRVPQPILRVLLVTTSGLFTFLAHERQQTFQSGLHLWDDAVAKVRVEDPDPAVGRWRPFLNRAVEHLDRGQIGLAQPDFLQAAALGDETGHAMAGYGITLQVQGRNEEALRAFAAADAAGFREVGFHYHHAEALLAVGRAAEAVSMFQVALEAETDPTGATQTRLRLAEAALEHGDAQRAREEFERLIRDHGEQPRLVTGLGFALLALGASEQALRLFDRAVTLQPGPRAFFGRAQARLAVGDRPGALADLSEAARLDPTNPAYRSLPEPALRPER